MPGDRERYEAMLLVAIREYEMIRSEAVTKLRDLKSRLRESRGTDRRNGETTKGILRQALLNAEHRLQLLKDRQIRAVSRRKKRAA